LSFATDAWTSPNQRAFVAITVHLEHQGEPIAMLLDIVEVAKSHTGENLASAFAKILEDYGISEKVTISTEYLNNIVELLTQPVLPLRVSLRRSHADAPPQFIRPVKTLTGLMVSVRVRRHPYRRNRSAPARGFSCGLRAFGSGSPSIQRT